MSARRDGVTRLNRGGVIQQNGRARGKYNLLDAIPAYLNHLRESKGDDTQENCIASASENYAFKTTRPKPHLSR